MTPNEYQRLLRRRQWEKILYKNLPITRYRAVQIVGFFHFLL
jgi:hypothetical protein